MICTDAPLFEVLRMAYGIRSFQLFAPDWMHSQRIDLTAQAPRGGLNLERKKGNIDVVIVDHANRRLAEN